jgi:heme-degrading monooxygenase HmoA
MFVRIWTFRVRPGRETAFEAAYGPDGPWARFFRSGGGFLGTALARDDAQPERYVTIDRWASRADFEALMARSREAYDALDRDLAPLTSEETSLGDFSSIGA